MSGTSVLSISGEQTLGTSLFQPVGFLNHRAEMIALYYPLPVKPGWV